MDKDKEKKISELSKFIEDAFTSISDELKNDITHFLQKYPVKGANYQLLINLLNYDQALLNDFIAILRKIFRQSFDWFSNKVKENKHYYDSARNSLRNVFEKKGLPDPVNIDDFFLWYFIEYIEYYNKSRHFPPPNQKDVFAFAKLIYSWIDSDSKKSLIEYYFLESSNDVKKKYQDRLSFLMIPDHIESEIEGETCINKLDHYIKNNFRGAKSQKMVFLFIALFDLGYMTNPINLIVADLHQELKKKLAFSQTEEGLRLAIGKIDNIKIDHELKIKSIKDEIKAITTVK